MGNRANQKAAEPVKKYNTWEECAAAGMTVAEAAMELGRKKSSGWSYARRNGLKFKRGYKAVSDAAAKRMKALRQQDWFNKKSNDIRSKIRSLPPDDRNAYKTYRKSGYSVNEAMAAINRHDLIESSYEL